MDQSATFPDWLARQQGLLSGDEQRAIAHARVSVLGLGGVGGVAAELLARAGVGALSICDPENFETSNLNRQVGALRGTLGQAKAQVMAARLREINPDLDLAVVDPVSDTASAKAALLGAKAGVLAIDALGPAVLAMRAARALGVDLVEALALPVIQVRVFVANGPDPEEGWPSQGRELGELDEGVLATAYTRIEAARWRDGNGAPLALEARAALAMAQGKGAASLGPMVWLAGSLAALEILKIIVGRGRVARYPATAAFDPAAWRLHFEE